MTRCAILTFAVVALLTGRAASQQPAQANENTASTDTGVNAWHLLEQTDTAGLLHGLPQRMSAAIVPSRRSTPAWLGVEGGGSLDLELERGPGVEGEVFVGFFRDPRFQVAEPVQVRSIKDADRGLLERLPPGDYYIGAIAGTDEPAAASGRRERRYSLGVEGTWPRAVHIRAGDTVSAKLRLHKASRVVSVHPDVVPGTFGDWGKVDPNRLAIVRTVDRAGQPLPYCFVRFTSRRRDDVTEIDQSFEVGTDGRGLTFFDQVSTPFTLNATQQELLPHDLSFRLWNQGTDKLYEPGQGEAIQLVLPPFPEGTATVHGRVTDQHGRPLTGYYISLFGSTDRGWIEIKKPVMAPDGRFEFRAVPPAEYRPMVRNFDYVTHDYPSGQEKVVVSAKPNERLERNFVVEAKELRYAKFMADGHQIVGGSWAIDLGGIGGVSYGFEGGTVRVAVSADERQSLIANSKGLVRLSVSDGQGQSVEHPVKLDDLSLDANAPTAIAITFAGRAEERAVEHKGEPLTSAPFATTTPMISDAFEVLSTGGTTIRASDLKGKPVLLNFFATWCSPCMAEFPHFVALAGEVPDSKLVVLAVSPEVDDPKWLCRKRPKTAS